MSLSHNRKVLFAGAALFAGVTSASLQACDDGALGGLAEKCGLVCPSNGVLEGNASISGVASVDSFFSAVLSLRGAAANVEASVRAEIDGIAGSLEIDTSGLSLGEAAAMVSAGVQAKISANVDGMLVIKYQPPKCEANLEVAVEAAAECDVSADPGSIEASCEGSCEVSAEVAAMCEAEGNLKCEGTAPNLQCDGTCSGTCQLEASAACSGTCNGTCSGTCNACVGGNCETDGMGNVTNCAGSCDAMCQGSCELEAGGSCSGSCEGSCEYTPPSGGCEASATAKCDASAMADVKCEGKCEGSVTPPEVSAECEASVEAKANAEVTCTPPSLSVDFQFAAGLDAQAQGEFKAWLKGFKGRFAALLAAGAKLDIVGKTAASVGGAGVAAVEGSINATLEGDLDLKASIGLGCAVKQLSAVTTVLTGVGTQVQGSVSAIGMVSGSVGADYDNPDLMVATFGNQG